MSFLRKLWGWIAQESKCTPENHVLRHTFRGAQKGWSPFPIPGTPCQCGQFKNWEDFRQVKFVQSMTKDYNKAVEIVKRVRKYEQTNPK